MTNLEKIYKINKHLYLGKSKIHNKGVFALKNIPARTRIIQYKGELISKEEGTKREEESIKLSKNDSTRGATYIFEIDKEHDLDGNIENNYAKYMNHSCNPNCEFEVKKKEVWIYTKKNIKLDQELCCNYGFDFEVENPLKHPCKCAAPNCVGYIVEKKSIKKLKEYLKKYKKSKVKDI